MNKYLIFLSSSLLLFLVMTMMMTNNPVKAQDYLHTFNYGNIDNTTNTRHFTLIVKENQTIPISSTGPQKFDAWTFNGTVPGPTMRMTEGDNVSITVINSADNKLPHSLHMHSIHPGAMDGVTGPGGSIPPGQNFTYNFIAQPYGVYPYHCHVEPVADHINRGLYGMMIIDPKEPRENMTEMVMLMNGYDMNYEDEGPVVIKDVYTIDPTKLVGSVPPKEEDNNNDNDDSNGNNNDDDKSNNNDETTTTAAEKKDSERDNEIYTVNGKAFLYTGDNEIQLELNKKYRIYLVNMLEFDLVNSFHLHGMMFNYFPSGTSKEPAFTNDIVTLGQGDRGIIEFETKYPGEYMFHAHINEFTSLGWSGFFNVK